MENITARASSINSTLNLTQEENIFSKYCSEDWRQILYKNQSVFIVNTGSSIFSEGEEVKGIFIINKGRVKVISSYDKTKERIHRLAGEGKLLGHRGFAASKYPVSAIALSETVVTFIPKDIFRTLIRTNPDLSIYIIDFMAEELREAEVRMKNFLNLDIKKRIAFILLYLIDTFGFSKNDPGKLAFTLSRKDFASISGTTYETVIRTLMYLQQNKLIRIVGKDICVPDTDKVKKLTADKK